MSKDLDATMANPISTEPILTHGVTERCQLDTPDQVAIEELARDGFTIIRGALSPAQVAKAASGLDSMYADQVAEFGEANIERIKDKYIVRSMLVFDPFFLHDVACNPSLLKIVKRVLGENISLSSQVGILNPPNEKLYQRAWHRELQYQHFTTSRPIAVQTLICIDRFNEESGATFFLPGSHLHEVFPSETYVRSHEYQITAEPGDAVLFNGLTYHRAGINRSPRTRRAINNLYTLPILQQQINLSRMLNGKYQDDPFLSGFLGYRWGASDSVIAWRQAHLPKLA